ncbi:hypothetical protein LQZ19_14605 [Treponema primitia]|uniref:hypothetical protein n=1 Tax=Treponema primitia TaxID=88058 RepID=UPI00397FD199
MKTFVLLLKTIQFCFRVLVKEGLKNYVAEIGPNSMHPSRELAVFGNGPSVKGIVNEENNFNFQDMDVFATNDFCFDNIFTEIQPKYYILSDPVYFLPESPLKDEVDKTFNILNETVGWPMFLYVQLSTQKACQDKIYNINIKVIPFHSFEYNGYQGFRNWFLKHGLCSESYGTVVLNAELIGINIGYKIVYLFGVEHTFFDNLYIDENNRLCSVIRHFFDDKPVLRPIVNYHNLGRETRYTMSEFLERNAKLFHGHEILREYADYCSVNIYNCTKNSLIDAYERK